MTAPAKPPGSAAAPKRGSDEPDLDALYDLAEEGKAVAKAGAVEASLRCPSCKSELEPGAAICVNCGFNLKTGSKAAPRKAAAAGAGMSAGRAPGGAAVLGAGAKTGAASALAAYGAPKRGLVQESRGEDKLLDLYIPIGLIALGFGLTMLLSTTFNAMIVPVPTAAMHAGLKLVLGFVLLAIGGIFCVQWGEIAFGEPGPAALKLAAMAIAPPAVAGIISFLVHDAPPVGWGMVGFFLAFGMFFTLNHYLFEWDMSEKWVVTGMATIVTMLAVPFLFAFIVGGGHLPGASHAANNEDAEVDYLFELRDPVSLQKWMDESHGRIFGSFTRDDSEALTKDLYACGPAKGEINVSAVGPQAAEIYVRLPSDAKKRKAFFDTVTKWNQAHQRGPATDQGEKWMIIRFMPFDRPKPM
jgi:hypothetical protein